MRKKIFVVLLLVVVLITSVGCNHESNPKAYQLDYYMDTIRPIGHFAGCDTPQSPISTIVLHDSNV